MKTILILRHAKSDWSDPSLADFDRPLAKRGLNDAPLMGEVLADFQCVPDMILSSPAKRAKQTAKIVTEACGYNKKSIQWENAFYHGSSANFIAALQDLPDKIERSLLVGHNPALEETVAALLSLDDNGWSDAFSIRLPTAGLVCLEANIFDWASLQPGDCVLRWFLIPKLVKVIQ